MDVVKSHAPTPDLKQRTKRNLLPKELLPDGASLLETLTEGLTYYCEHCRFTSKHKLGLKLHIESNHLKMEFPPNIQKAARLLKKCSQKKATRFEDDKLLVLASLQRPFTFMQDSSSIQINTENDREHISSRPQVSIRKNPKDVLLKPRSGFSKHSKIKHFGEFQPESPQNRAQVDSSEDIYAKSYIQSTQDLLGIKDSQSNFLIDCTSSATQKLNSSSEEIDVNLNISTASDVQNCSKTDSCENSLNNPKLGLLKPRIKMGRKRKAIPHRTYSPMEDLKMIPADDSSESSSDVVASEFLEINHKLPEAVLLKPKSARIASKCDFSFEPQGEVKDDSPEAKCKGKGISNSPSSPLTDDSSQDKTTMVDNVYKSKPSLSAKSDYFSNKASDSTEKVKLPCSMCDYEANRLGDLKKHVKSQHLGIKYRCHYCDHQLTDISSLNKHIEFKHLLSKYICAVCGYKARQVNGLLKHVKSQHLLLSAVCEHTASGGSCSCNKLQCPSIDCDYRDGNVDDFLEHFKKEHIELEVPLDPDSNDGQSVREVIHSCPHCSYSSGRKSDLRKHVKSQHLGIRYPCSHCSYQATEVGSLRVHIRSQHLGYKYPCSFCDYEAKWVGDLKKHIKSQHLGIRYPCSYCDYKATEASCLNRHIKTKHSNLSEDEKPVQVVKEEPSDVSAIKYLCHHCGLDFAKYDVLHDHIISEHNGIDDPYYEGNG